MTKCYVIKNAKSGCFFTRYGTFDNLSMNVEMFPTRRAAERYIPVATRYQIWALLEAVYNKPIEDIDISREQYDNIKELVELNVKVLNLTIEEDM